MWTFFFYSSRGRQPDWHDEGQTDWNVANKYFSVKRDSVQFFLLVWSYALLQLTYLPVLLLFIVLSWCPPSITFHPHFSLFMTNFHTFLRFPHKQLHGYTKWLFCACIWCGRELLAAIVRPHVQVENTTKEGKGHGFCKVCLAEWQLIKIFDLFYFYASIQHNSLDVKALSVIINMSKYSINQSIRVDHSWQWPLDSDWLLCGEDWYFFQQK